MADARLRACLETQRSCNSRGSTLSVAPALTRLVLLPALPAEALLYYAKADGASFSADEQSLIAKVQAAAEDAAGGELQTYTPGEEDAAHWCVPVQGSVPVQASRRASDKRADGMHACA